MTTESNAPETSLPESDYLALLDVILKLHDCETQDTLKHAVEFSVLPLFDAQATVYGWCDPDISSIQLGGVIGWPELPKELNELAPTYDSLTQALISSNRSVVAYDVDMDRSVIPAQGQKLVDDHPEFKDYSEFAKKIRTALMTVSKPVPTMGIGLHRFIEKPFTRRDVRLMELLRPHLMQVMKSVMLNSELAKHKSLVEALANVTTAVALVSPEMRVLFANDAFKQLAKAEEGHLLPASLSELLDTEIGRIRVTDPRKESYIEMPFYRVAGDVHRLSLTYLKGRGVEEDRCWLVRLKPAADPYSQMHLKMQEAGLTPREIEISALVKDGFDDQEIADRLFISVHTVATHVKNIYRKLDVGTRPKLMAALNPESSQAGENQK